MIDKKVSAALVAVMIGTFAAMGPAYAAPKGESASTATPSTPEQDAKLKSSVKNAGRKIKEKTQGVIAKVRGKKSETQQTSSTRSTPRSSRADTVSRAPDVQSSQTREQRMAEARANWERNRKM
jgi:hypothetical protein